MIGYCLLRIKKKNEILMLIQMIRGLWETEYGWFAVRSPFTGPLRHTSRERKNKTPIVLFVELSLFKTSKDFDSRATGLGTV